MSVGSEGVWSRALLLYVSCLKISDQTIYFSRHGESEYNIEDRIGGDPDLSKKGKKYPPALNSFFQTHFEHYPFRNEIRIVTSTLKRAV